MTEAGTLEVPFPAAPSKQTGVVFRECVASLVQLATGTNLDVAAIETLRKETLGNHVTASPATIASRVWFSVLCDLASQGWQLTVVGDAVLLRVAEAVLLDPAAEKERVRNGHLIERDRYLKEEPVRRFVREMEASRLHRGEWKSIFSLMRDGRSLSIDLAAAANQHPTQLRSVIRPYLQVIDSASVCEFTGLRLLDVWRYFRLTWSTIPQSVPGRRMLVLVRDSAVDNHPVIGIAALGSAVVQLSVRDKWIRWTADEFIADLRGNASTEEASWLLDSIADAIDDVYRYDLARAGLVRARDIVRPTEKVIARLRVEAKRARAAHNRYSKTGRHKHATMRPAETDWKEQAKSFLFRSKRCVALATALEVRLILNELGMRRPTRDALLRVLDSAKGRRAVSSTLRYVKAKHVGIDMADITVCGAVAPYTHVLGGKLVSLILASPELVTAYRKRYAQSPSLIASAVKGQLVQRRPNLVLLGTTSLYGVASSQYNRLVIPAQALEAAADIRFQELGRTEGFGSYHFSKATTDEMNVLAQQQRGGRRVNNIFGEGVNPKLRRLREALAAVGFPSDQLLKHGSPRLVYGVALAENFRDILTGRAQRPKYLLKTETAGEGTEAIADYWRERWLARRIQSPAVLVEVARHSTLRPVVHGARVHPQDERAGLPLFETAPADAM